MSEDSKNIFKIASVYTGTILGAGFASGQEIKQFFVYYGPQSIYGLILSAVLFALIGIVVLNKIYSKRICTYDQYIVPLVGVRAEHFIEILVCLFMLSSFCVMVAGSGAIFYEEFRINKEIGIIVMVILCLIVFLFDAKGVVAINTLLTPIMLIGIALLGSYILIFKDTDVIALTNIAQKAAYNWFSSSLIYVSYNTLTIVVIMTALHPLITKRKVAIISGLLSGLALGIIAFILWAVLLMFYSDILPYEIPFLHIIMKKGKVMELIYIFILYCAMFTTAVSSGFGFLNRAAHWLKINRKICIILFCGLAIPLAQIGFSNMVKNMYSLFGYLGMFMIVIILFDGIRGLVSSKRHIQ
ncbi:MAG: hypothetical protein AB7G87_13265 [Clostridia bacterium]